MTRHEEEIFNQLTRYSSHKGPKFKLWFPEIRPFEKGYLIDVSSPRIYVRHFSFLLLNQEVITPSRFETHLVRLVTRTKFTNYLVKDHKYAIDFSGFDEYLVNALFTIALQCEKNSSWLEPLQELLLNPPKKSKYGISSDDSVAPLKVRKPSYLSEPRLSRFGQKIAKSANVEKTIWMPSATITSGTIKGTSITDSTVHSWPAKKAPLLPYIDDPNPDIATMSQDRYNNAVQQYKQYMFHLSDLTNDPTKPVPQPQIEDHANDAESGF